LIVDDPQASDPADPTMSQGHWIVDNLPIARGSLPEGVTTED